HHYGAISRPLIYIYTSAVKRLKYLIAINRIYVIVNSKLIAINRKFVSILNVPSFIFFSIFLFLFECPYQHGKVDLLSLCKCFILLKTNIVKQGGTKYNIKCTFQVNKDSIVQLNHGLIFSSFQVCWEHSSQASYFSNIAPS